MTLINTVTVGSGGASSITFSSITQTFTDLFIVMSGRSGISNTRENVFLSFNGSTASFNIRTLYAAGSTVASETNTTAYSLPINGNTSLADTFSNSELYISNYSGSTNKAFSAEGVSANNANNNLLQINGGLWANTAAITSITLNLDSLSFRQNTTVSLYGITKGSGGATAA
jgi:hypothetical protein